ncbi:MAG: hypothetical protein WBE76_13230 [Terracidiphilus sp.]
MAKRDTLSLLDEFDRLELDKGLFQHKLHHLGCSFESFHKWASHVSSFKPMGGNQLLHDRLVFVLSQVRNGASANPSSLEKLIEQSWIDVPCSGYPNCRGHRFDPNCKHRH